MRYAHERLPIPLREIPCFQVGDPDCPEQFVRVLTVPDLRTLASIEPLLCRNKQWALIELDGAYGLVLVTPRPVYLRSHDLADR